MNMYPRNPQMGVSKYTHCILYIIIALVLGCSNFGFAWYTIFTCVAIGHTLGCISFTFQEWTDYFFEVWFEDDEI